MNIRFSYLKEKFTKYFAEHIFERIWSDVVSSGDFTLGKAVTEFETRFAQKMGVKYAIGVANGTDALELSMWAAGVRAGDEVIAPANTFVASLGAIGNLQARPVLVDIGHDYVMDVSKVAAAITHKTRAIMPVSFCGNPVDLDPLFEIAKRYNLKVIGDNCQSYLAEYKGKCVGSMEYTGCFSLHPLKILNCWGDGGVITTNDEEVYKEIRLHQNHGMADRNTYTRFPCRNSRLDSIHAVVCNTQIDDVPSNVAKRRDNAKYYDDNLKDTVYIIKRNPERLSVYHLYFIEVDYDIRDTLYQFLIDAGIEVKIHYKTPLYLQPGLEVLGYKRGDFPVADMICDRIITLPVDELVTREMQNYVISKIKEFFKCRSKVKLNVENSLSW